MTFKFGVAFKVVLGQRLFKEEDRAAKQVDALYQGSGLLARVSLIGIDHERHAGTMTVQGFHPAKVFVHVMADLHFEETKAPFIPLSAEFPGSLQRGDGNGDVRFTRTHVRSAP